MQGVSRWSNFPKNSRNRCHMRPRAASAAPRSRLVVSSPARMLPATLAPNRSSWSIRGNICATNHNPRSARNAFRPNDRSSSISSTSAEVDEIELDLSFGRKAFLALRGLWFVAQMFPRMDQLDRFGANVAGNIRAGLDTTSRDLGAAEAARGRMWHLFREFFGKFDHLLTPCMAIPPFPVDQNYPETVAGRKMETYVDWIAPTFVLSLSGLPVASVPCGVD